MSREGARRSQPARKANQSSRSNRSQPQGRANQDSAANQRAAANQRMKPTTREPTLFDAGDVKWQQLLAMLISWIRFLPDVACDSCARLQHLLYVCFSCWGSNGHLLLLFCWFCHPCHCLFNCCAWVLLLGVCVPQLVWIIWYVGFLSMATC